MVSRSAAGVASVWPSAASALRPVDSFCHPWHFIEIEPAELLGHLDDLTAEALGHLGCTHADDRDLTFDVRIVDPVIQAAALEGVVDLSSSVAREDHEWWTPRADRAAARGC